MKITNSNINVQLVQLHHIEPIFQLESDSFQGNGFPYFFFRQAFDCMGDFFIIAELEGDLVGYALGTLQVERHDAWVLGIAVSEKVRHMGTASIMLKKLLSIFKAKGAKCAMLHVSPDNEPALILYTKHGFVEIKREENYFGTGQTRAMMRMN
ncbi:MAG: GNAT family N-acetyltransferase [Desulfobacterales bacterium]|nr:GNAT family N-acetyltransferase [Desulfobacterales bacterium]